MKGNEEAQLQSHWYDRKLQWTQELLVTAEAGFDQLAAVSHSFMPR